MNALHKPSRKWLLTCLLAGLASATQAHEYFAPNLTVHHPWTRASAPGERTAIVSMTIDEVTQSDRLIGASTPMAERTEMGGGGEPGAALSIPIPAGQTTELNEITLHLRLVGLKAPLEMAREYPLTLVFERAGTLPAKLLIDFPPRTGREPDVHRPSASHERHGAVTAPH
jgi:periplasmic copper chaperone A